MLIACYRDSGQLAKFPIEHITEEFEQVILHSGNIWIRRSRLSDLIPPMTVCLFQMHKEVILETNLVDQEWMLIIWPCT